MSFEHFELDKRLANSSVLIAQADFIQIRLSKDARYPWVLLVPEINDISEMYELSQEQQYKVLAVSNLVSKALTEVFSPDKLNIAAIGNIVKQLHIHHVARFEYDEAWPAPIWGLGEEKAYAPEIFSERVASICKAIEHENKGEIHVNYYNE